MTELARSRADGVAAVDLGSNSFHMIIARQTGHDLEILDRLREPVRLAQGLRPGGTLGAKAQERALACLERFGERLRGIPADRVRAVGTNTLRQARHSPGFRGAAERALGRSIEVISGVEEARLIYLGVAHTMPALRERRLVVDIGGGSTELILGHDFDVEIGSSLQVGCVVSTEEYFPGGEITRERFRSAQTTAALELQPSADRFREAGWEVAYGASGTINSLSEILRQMGLSDGTLDRDALKQLRRMMVSAGHVDHLRLPGLRADRAPVIPGGLAILLSIFKTLRIESMRPTAGALREGVLYDLVGRIRHEDVRDRTIGRLVQQYRVDEYQSQRVMQTALRLFEQVREAWSLDEEEHARLLRWAAQLHEIGLAVAHSGHHKHGAYLVQHSDMPGFSRDDQAVLSAILRGQRRKLRMEYFTELPTHRVEDALHLCVLLRLSVLLHRSRHAHVEANLAVTDGGSGLELGLDGGEIEERPLTLADLGLEINRLQAVGLQLRLGPA